MSVFTLMFAVFKTKAGRGIEEKDELSVFLEISSPLLNFSVEDRRKEIISPCCLE